jgi:DNA-binding PadR family transcriptional regulator
MKTKKVNLGDLIFILFYKYGGEIRGNTTLQKLVDIIRLDSNIEVDIDYSAYEFGDFSPQLNDILQVFIDNSWINSERVPLDENKKINIYKLTEKGSKIANTIYQNLLSKELEEFNVIDKFINQSQDEILAYSYFWYPMTAMRSKIKGRIFNRGKISRFLSGDLEDEYNKIKDSGESIKEVIYESWKC